MKQLLQLRNRVMVNHPSKPLAVLICGFIFLSLFARGIGGTNEMSRYATMEALSTNFSFEITDYRDWTLDWSKVGDKYYSNKAPGPAILGFPAYLFSKIFFKGSAKQGPPRSTQRVIVVLLTKLIPLGLLLFWGFTYLINLKVFTREEGYLLLVLILYASTPSLFYNSFFGHGTSSLFMLLAFIALFLKRGFLCGLAFGFSLLSEYSAALFLLPLLLATPFRQLVKFSMGGIVPGVVWLIFHLETTGSPFITITSYMNPLFLSSDPKFYNGMLSFPDLRVIAKLLLGFERGLLVSQPWALFSLFHVSLLCFKKSIGIQERRLFIATIASSFFLILLNSSFNNWHGGATSGPRYLSLLILPLAFSQVVALKHLKRGGALQLFLALVLVSVVIRSCIYATTPLAPEGRALFGALIDFYLQHGGVKSVVRLMVFWGVVSFSGYLILKKEEIHVLR